MDTRFCCLVVTMLATMACKSGDKAAELADYGAAIADARALVEEHVVQVDEAGAMEEVDALEADFAVEWSGCMAALTDAMDEVEQCGMSDDGMMGRANDRMMDLDDRVGDHVVAHDDHVDMQACIDAERDLRSGAEDDCDGMMSDHDRWSDDAGQCMSAGMM